jgi:hypothetical protein
MKTVAVTYKCQKCGADLETSELLQYPDHYHLSKVNFGGLCEACDELMSETERAAFLDQGNATARAHLEALMADGKLLADLRRETDQKKD